MKVGLAGDTDAAGDLAQIYQRGWGVTADSIEAYAWDAVAASRGSALAETERDRILKGLIGDAVARAEAGAKELDGSIAAPAGPPRAAAWALVRSRSGDKFTLAARHHVRASSVIAPAY